MRSFFSQVLVFLFLGSLDILWAHEEESLMEKSMERTNLRGNRKLTGSLPRLGLIENKEIPSWIAKDTFVRPDDGYEMYGLYDLHKAFRKQKYPLQLRPGMQKVFDDGVIEQIEGNDADSYTLKIKPSSICDHSREDVEDSLDWTAESMVQNGASKYKVYLDVEDLKATDFMPACMGKWSGIFDGMEQAKFPLKMKKVVAYPVPDAMLPAAQSLLNFASGDAVINNKIVGTNEELDLSNELGLPLVDVLLAGGPKKYINKKKKKILPLVR
eukprot:CAMPEP_0197447816 /NCGR_PEP_ID=MMETSP1175-20131217/14884_1 /TAXON_ID=1003142 /ORGANISM="Triceratium dubium, Strain CCMP147" /LENGTH=269 /DNA_ID=CAMNT_0042979327 /DNA_START=107 /DNA_END=916 /DNA_ORIENTATION=-